MSDALAIAATGMQAQQLHVESIANNLANVQTPGYKKTRMLFADLVMPGMARAAGDAPLALVAGAHAGVGIASAARLFDAGDMKKTESPWDLAIQGEGFLEVAMPDGSRAYVRGGTFQLNADGQLATPSGLPLKPGIHIPDNAEGLLVSFDGDALTRALDRGLEIALDGLRPGRAEPGPAPQVRWHA